MLRLLSKRIYENEIMKPTYKIMLKAFVAGGTVFAVVMAMWDLIDSKQFNVWKFMANLIFFGLFMALYMRYNYKKQIQKIPNSNL